jgi:hypothetical protein
MTAAQFGCRLLCAAVVFFAAEGAVFRTGLYTRVLDPDSSVGLLVNLIEDEKRRSTTGPNDVLAIGHSRMGFRPREANALENETGLYFAEIIMPGSTPRCWHYMLRAVDPDARRYAAVLIGVDDYDDEDYEDLSAREMDIRYLAPLLGWGDVVSFTASYPDWPLRWLAFRAAVFKGYAYRADLQDFLVNHKRRMKRVEWTRRESAGFRYHHPWGQEDVSGLSVDWKTGTIQYPPQASQQQKEIIRNVLLRETVEQTGQRGRYLREWYGRIAAYYRGSRTRVIFLRLPRGPVVRPRMFTPKSAVARELARENASVLLLPEHAFDAFEEPVNFGDPMHLNGRGAAEFSRMAAREVVKVLR